MCRRFNPGLDHHRRCHIKMKDELKTSMDDLLSGESMGRKGMDQPQFIEFLRHWMLEHIIKEDLLLKPYLKSE